MAKLQTTKRLITAIYSFAVDGGAISSINMGIFIPNNAIVTNFYVKTNTAPTSAGAATIAFGHAGDTDAFMVITGIAAFVAAEILAGVNFIANPIEINNADGRQLQITIATAALTAGILLASVEYTEEDL